MMKCGFSKVKITPKNGAIMAGTMEVKHSTGVLDDLYARAVSFFDGETKALVISIDLCNMGNDVNDECRERISKECGMDIDAIMLTCVHTHAGPLASLTQAPDNKYTKEDCEQIVEYREFLIEKICESARLSFETLAPAKFYTATDKAEGIAHTRRFRMTDGRVVTNPGMDWNCSGDPITCCPIPDNTGVAEALSKPDETVRILKIEREGEKDICIVNFGLHATSAHVRKISADYPGRLCGIVERAIDNVNCVFIQGAEGDVAQINRNPSEAERRFLTEDNENAGETLNKTTQLAQVIASCVLRKYMVADSISDGKIFFGKKDLALPANKDDSNYDEALRIVELHKEGRHHELPYDGMELVTVLAKAKRVVRLKDAPDFFSYSFFAMAFGDFAFIGTPGELFTELGARIFAESPYKHTMLCGITNVRSTYFLTDKALLEGGYEAVTSNIGVGSEGIMVEGAKELLCSLKNASER